MATAVKTARTLIAAGTSNGAGSTTRGTLSLGTALGGVLTVKIANGATGPTVPATANVLVAHNGTAPTAGSAGVDWKTLTSVQHNTTNSATGEWFFDIPTAVMSLEVEFTGNTAQAVTVEAFFSELTSVG